MALQGTKRTGQTRLKNLKEAEERIRIEQANHYITALKRHNELSQSLIENWKKIREEERKTRNKYACWIFIVAVVQSLLVYVGTVYCFISFKNTTPLEVFGLTTLVCSQTFGLVFVVVKYFFGQKPEGLCEIMRFIYKTYPNPPYFSVPDKKLDSNF